MKQKRGGRSRDTSGIPSKRSPRSLAAIWNGFWFREVDPRGLAAFRIAFGAFLLAEFLAFLPDVETMFSNRGVYVPVLVDLAFSPSLAWILYGALVLSLVLFVLGWRTPVLAPVLFALYLHHFLLNLAVRNTAHDRLVVILLFVCCFAELDGAWSISRRPPAQTVSVWPARVLGLQLAALYLGSGIWKLLSPSWHTGEMLEMTLVGPWGTSAAFALVGAGWPPWAWNAATFGVVAFELGAGFGLHIRRLRKATMAAGLFFHLANWILLGIPEFMVCVTIYPVLLGLDLSSAQRDARAGAWDFRLA